MGETLDYADRLWRGEETITSGHQLFAGLPIEECTDGVAFLPTFANVSAFSTDDGLFLVDTGSRDDGRDHPRPDPLVVGQAAAHRRLLPRPCRPRLRRTGLRRRRRRRRAGAPRRSSRTRRCRTRFDRYKMTAGYNEIINQRQFQVPRT